MVTSVRERGWKPIKMVKKSGGGGANEGSEAGWGADLSKYRLGKGHSSFNF